MELDDRIKDLAHGYATQHNITDAVEIECLEALFAYQELLTANAGQTRRASRTWQMFKRHGIIGAVELVVERPDDALGYTVLVEMGLQKYAFEAVILRHPSKFTTAAVLRSKQRLEQLVTTSEIGGAWSDEELLDSVRAYIEMQRLHRNSESFTKRSYYQQLSAKHGRTEKAYEYRMQNISYVLSLMGREWLPGLKPAKNVGANVADKIQGFIEEVEGNSSISSAAFEIAVYESLKKSQAKPPKGKPNPTSRTTQLQQFERDPRVKAWVLRRAKGQCECCSNPAPFTRSDGLPYLEVHHVRHMADDGPDVTSNTVALCPNCHRELHYGIDTKVLIDRLFLNVPELIKH